MTWRRSEFLIVILLALFWGLVQFMLVHAANKPAPGHLSRTYLLEYHAQPLITGRGVLTLEWAGCDSSGTYSIHFGETQDWEGSVWGLSDDRKETVKIFPWALCDSDTTVFVESGAVFVIHGTKPLWVATRRGVAEIYTDCGEATP